MGTEAQDFWIGKVLGISLSADPENEEGGPFESVKDWAAKRKAKKAAKKAETPEQKAERLQRLRANHTFGGHQKARAETKFDALPPNDQENMNVLLDAARSQDERNYLMKALASDHAIDEIVRFAQEIRGKNAQWLQDNLMLTGDTSGKGIQQQWVMSCQATTVQAVKGMMDPIYALDLRKKTGDVSQLSSAPGDMAAEQKTMLNPSIRPPAEPARPSRSLPTSPPARRALAGDAAATTS